MRIGILTFEQFRGQKNLGSSRIRGHWVNEVWPEAELFVQGKNYDVVIYQKAYYVDHAKLFKGIKIFDICDPDFLHWGYRTIEMINECDAVTTSTESLAKVIRNFTDKPVYCVPDRIKLSDADGKLKYHKGEARTIGWFGYSHNFDVLKSAVTALKRTNYNLVVISDGMFSPGSASAGQMELLNVPFNWDTFYDDLLDCDIVINPQKTTGKWQYKSNNKTLIAWLLGLPVANDIDALQYFKDETARREEQVKRKKELEDKWDVRYSVEDYKRIISELQK